MHQENAAPVAKDSQFNAFTLMAIGALACVASIFNPLSPTLIIARNSTDHSVGEGLIPFSAFWLIVSVFICGLFIGILGPGISFSH